MRASNLMFVCEIMRNAGAYFFCSWGQTNLFIYLAQILSPFQITCHAIHQFFNLPQMVMSLVLWPCCFRLLFFFLWFSDTL